MSEGVLETKGTRLYFADPLSASSSDPDGVVILYVACPTAITGLGGSKPQINKSCLGSEEDEFFPGRPSPGQISVPFNAIFRSAAHQALIDLDASSRIISWMVVFSDAAANSDFPTSVDSDDRLVSAGPTTVEFMGYVSDLNFDLNQNEIVRGTLVIQRTGAKVWDLPTADLD
jgi:hypothetical protein